MKRYRIPFVIFVISAAIACGQTSLTPPPLGDGGVAGHPVLGGITSSSSSSGSSAAPTGTGFAHVTNGAYDSAARAVNLSGADVTSSLPLASVVSPTGTGLAKVSSGAWSAAAATLVDADVSASAAVAGTKISPSFGSQNIVTTGNIAVGGSSPATAGAIQLPNATAIEALNAAASANLVLLSTDASNNAFICNSSNCGQLIIGMNASAVSQVPYVYMGGSTATYLYGGGTNWLTLQSTGITGNDPAGTAATYGEISQYLANDFTTTTTSSLQSSNLTFAMGASDVFIVQFGGVFVAGANTSGVFMGISIPTSASIEGGVAGNAATGLSTIVTAVIAAGATAYPASALCAVSAEACPYWGSFRVKGDGTHAGSVVFQVKPGTTTAVTMKAGSWWSAQRGTAL